MRWRSYSLIRSAGVVFTIMLSLTCLSPEIPLLIFNILPFWSLKHLRATCKTHYHTLTLLGLVLWIDRINRCEMVRSLVSVVDALPWLAYRMPRVLAVSKAPLINRRSKISVSSACPGQGRERPKV